MLANGLLPSDRRLLFSSLVPSSNEEVERQYWDAAEQMELEEAEDEAAAPARQLQARKEYVRMLAEAHAARQGPAAEQPPLVGPPPLVQPPPRLPPLVPPRPPLPPGRGPDPVIKDEDDEQAALLHQLILLTIARICKQRVRTLLLTTPQAVRVMCGVEPRWVARAPGVENCGGECSEVGAHGCACTYSYCTAARVTEGCMPASLQTPGMAADLPVPVLSHPAAATSRCGALRRRPR